MAGVRALKRCPYIQWDTQGKPWGGSDTEMRSTINWWDPPTSVYTRTPFLYLPFLWIALRCVICFWIISAQLGAYLWVRFPNAFHLCFVTIATSSGCTCVPMTVGDPLCGSNAKSSLSTVLCTDFLQKRIGEVRWCRVGLSRFAPFSYSISCPTLSKPRANSALPIWFFSLPAHWNRPLLSLPLFPSFPTTLKPALAQSSIGVFLQGGGRGEERRW